jgi:hypothetical protein
MGDLLQPVGNGPDHDIAALPWRVGAKESQPLEAQVAEAELSHDRRAVRQPTRAVRRVRRSPGPIFRTVRRPGVVLIKAAGSGPFMPRGDRIVGRQPR